MTGDKSAIYKYHINTNEIPNYFTFTAKVGFIM